MSLDELVRSATSRAGIVRVRNALNPVPWLCAVTTPSCFLFAYILGSDAVLRYALAGLGSLPVGVGLFSCVYFMPRDPDRLQSGEFVLKQLEIRVTERKSLPPAVDDVLMIDDASKLLFKSKD